MEECELECLHCFEWWETKNSSGTCLNFLLQLLLFTVSGIKVDFISLSEIFSRQ